MPSRPVAREEARRGRFFYHVCEPLCVCTNDLRRCVCGVLHIGIVLLGSWSCGRLSPSDSVGFPSTCWWAAQLPDPSPPLRRKCVYCLRGCSECAACTSCRAVYLGGCGQTSGCSPSDGVAFSHMLLEKKSGAAASSKMCVNSCLRFVDILRVCVCGVVCTGTQLWGKRSCCRGSSSNIVGSLRLVAGE